MVGKVWSDAEEHYFWRTAVAHSSKRAGVDCANLEKSWERLAADMQRDMDRLRVARRTYTGTMLFEHFFQNVEGQRHSPNAGRYVNEYMAKIGPCRQIANPHARRPYRTRGTRRKAATKSGRKPKATAPSPIPVNSPSVSATSSVGGEKSTRDSRARRPLRRLVAAPAPSPEQVATPSSAAYTNNSDPRGMSDHNSYQEPIWGYEMGKKDIPSVSFTSRPTQYTPSQATSWDTYRENNYGYQPTMESASEVPSSLAYYPSHGSLATSVAGQPHSNNFNDGYRWGYQSSTEPASEVPSSLSSYPSYNSFASQPRSKDADDGYKWGYQPSMYPAPSSQALSSATPGYHLPATTFDSGLSSKAAVEGYHRPYYNTGSENPQSHGAWQSSQLQSSLAAEPPHLTPTTGGHTSRQASTWGYQVGQQTGHELPPIRNFAQSHAVTDNQTIHKGLTGLQSYAPRPQFSHEYQKGGPAPIEPSYPSASTQPQATPMSVSSGGDTTEESLFVEDSGRGGDETGGDADAEHQGEEDAEREEDADGDGVSVDCPPYGPGDDVGDTE